MSRAAASTSNLEQRHTFLHTPACNPEEVAPFGHREPPVPLRGFAGEGSQYASEAGGICGRWPLEGQSYTAPEDPQGARATYAKERELDNPDRSEDRQHQEGALKQGVPVFPLIPRSGAPPRSCAPKPDHDSNGSTGTAYGRMRLLGRAGGATRRAPST